MLSHLRGLLAFSENGTVNDVSPIWNVIGAVAAQTKTLNSSPKITDLYTLRHSKLPPLKKLKWA
jgi:hypothetical protein